MQKTTWSEKTEKELYDQAVAAYFRKAKSSNVIPMQPSENQSDVEGDIVHLQNINGTIAKYNYKTQRFVDEKKSHCCNSGLLI
jgi:hypothetical protein